MYSPQEVFIACITLVLNNNNVPKIVLSTPFKNIAIESKFEIIKRQCSELQQQKHEGQRREVN